MYPQTLISILVWIAVFCSIGVESDIVSESRKRELVNKLKTLVHHLGWQFMEDVKIKKNKRKEIVNPISEIFEAITLHREPINESNVLEKYMDIWTVLMCKYNEIITSYKNIISHFIRVCQDEKHPSDSFRRYYDCFDSLVLKLHTMTQKFQCMTDAVDFMYKLGPQSKHKYILPGMQKLTDYTSTIRQSTLPKLSERDTTEDVIDIEINAIGEYIAGVCKKNLYWFTFEHCNVTRNKKWTVQSLAEEFVYAKDNRLIPQEMTLMRYVEKEYDDYVDEIIGKWFNDLGFTYDDEGKLTIGTN